MWPIDGDINYDGQVNVPDFLLLVDNFGQTGVVPTSRMVIEDALATGGSGTVITIRDTIYQTRSGSPQEERAKKLLGFWKLRASRLPLDHYYLMGYIFHERTLDSVELAVLGSDSHGIMLIGGYSTNINKFTILDSGITLNLFYVFDIQNDKVIGDMYFI